MVIDFKKFKLLDPYHENIFTEIWSVVFFTIAESVEITPLSANPIKSSNTLKQFLAVAA